MKRIFGLVLFLFLSGCSLFSSHYDPHEWIQEFGALIEQDNQNDQHIQKIGELNKKIQHLASLGDDQKIDQILTLVQQEQKEIQIYRSNLENIQNQLPNLLDKGAKIESSNSAELAEGATKKFQLVLQSELQYAQLLHESSQKNQTFFSEVKSGKTNPSEPPKELEEKIQKTEERLKQVIQELNQASKQFESSLKQTASN